GDIILKFNGRDIERASDLPRLVGETKPGSRVPMQLWRKGGTREVTITVAELEPDAKPRPRAGTTPGDDGAAGAKPNALGLVVGDLSEARLRELKI
ncbi:S1C family serine protease, partial [Salmonella enterica subsp. enterica serovar Typhimurium]|nr:S1C family serine protease [Salmonella enterica subsp. enterica serovar Typhimurium]